MMSFRRPCARWRGWTRGGWRAMSSFPPLPAVAGAGTVGKGDVTGQSAGARTGAGRHDLRGKSRIDCASLRQLRSPLHVAFCVGPQDFTRAVLRSNRSNARTSLGFAAVAQR